MLGGTAFQRNLNCGQWLVVAKFEENFGAKIAANARDVD